MASLAPGNGWFPHRAYGSPQAYNGKAVPRQTIGTSRNVYEIRHIGIPVISRTAVGSGRWIISKTLNLLVIESLKTGHTATWMLAWGVFAAVLTLILWLGFMAAIVGSAIAFGVPWTTVAVAVVAIHILAAILIILLGVRIGRNLLLSAEKRNQVANESEAP
jgi:hypothetical protein